MNRTADAHIAYVTAIFLSTVVLPVARAASDAADEQSRVSLRQMVDEGVAVMPWRVDSSARLAGDELRQFQEQMLEVLRSRSGGPATQLPAFAVITKILSLAEPCIDAECLVLAGARLNASTVLSGAVAREQGEWRVTLVLTDVASRSQRGPRGKFIQGDHGALVEGTARLLASMMRADIALPILYDSAAPASSDRSKPAVRPSSARAVRLRGDHDRPAVKVTGVDVRSLKRACTARDEHACAELRSRGLGGARNTASSVSDACDAGSVRDCEAMLKGGEQLPFGRGARITGSIIAGVGIGLMGLLTALMVEEGATDMAPVLAVGGVVAGAGAGLFAIGAYRGSAYRWRRQHPKRQRAALEAQADRHVSLGWAFAF